MFIAPLKAVEKIGSEALCSLRLDDNPTISLEKMQMIFKNELPEKLKVPLLSIFGRKARFAIGTIVANWGKAEYYIMHWLFRAELVTSPQNVPTIQHFFVWPQQCEHTVSNNH